MNPVSRILLGALILAVCACVWFLLTHKNSGGCGGDCGSCSRSCDSRKDREK